MKKPRASSNTSGSRMKTPSSFVSTRFMMGQSSLFLFRQRDEITGERNGAGKGRQGGVQHMQRPAVAFHDEILRQAAGPPVDQLRPDARPHMFAEPARIEPLDEPAGQPDEMAARAFLQF